MLWHAFIAVKAWGTLVVPALSNTSKVLSREWHNTRHHLSILMNIRLMEARGEGNLASKQQTLFSNFRRCRYVAPGAFSSFVNQRQEVSCWQHFSHRWRKERCQPLQDTVCSMPYSRWGRRKQDRSQLAWAVRTPHWLCRGILIYRCQQAKEHWMEPGYSRKSSGIFPILLAHGY